MYALIAAKDGAELNQVTVPVAGKSMQFPLESSDRIPTLPYIPDVLSRGAALRDLPGSPEGAISALRNSVGTARLLPTTSTAAYEILNDPNPRPGSATLISFGGETDWQTAQPFRFALADGNAAPQWDADNRVLTVSLPKGTTHVVPLSSYLNSDDLKWMGVWQWLREYIEFVTTQTPQSPIFLELERSVDEIAHILQLTIEGGHWMITPPRLLKLIHAVQQPIGVPTFTGLTVQRQSYDEQRPDPKVLQTQSEEDYLLTGRTELSPITAWRKLGATDAYLLGGLEIHAASTAKVNLLAEWEDPIDDPMQSQPTSTHVASPVEEIPIYSITKMC